MNKLRKAKNTEEADVSGLERARQNCRRRGLRGSQESTTCRWGLAAVRTVLHPGQEAPENF